MLQDFTLDHLQALRDLMGLQREHSRQHQRMLVCILSP